MDGISIADERKKEIDFSEPFATSPRAGCVRRRKEFITKERG